MKSPLVLVSVFLAAFTLYAAETPPEIAPAKARYKAAVAAGNKTAGDQYIKDLQKLKSGLKPKKNKSLIEAIDAEIKAVNSAPAKGPAKGDLPFGKVVPGRPGFVTSPYEPYKGFIDVHGIAPGSQVICPYSLKPFLVPQGAE